MLTAEQQSMSWIFATVDFLLAVVGFTIVFYPLVSLGNAVFGSPVSASIINVIIGVLAIGGAYPVVAGNWSLGRLGEYVFVLSASVLGWGLLGMLALLASGLTLPGSSSVPQLVLWITALLTAYLLVYRFQVSIL